MSSILNSRGSCGAAEAPNQEGYAGRSPIVGSGGNTTTTTPAKDGPRGECDRNRPSPTNTREERKLEDCGSSISSTSSSPRRMLRRTKKCDLGDDPLTICPKNEQGEEEILSVSLKGIEITRLDSEPYSGRNFKDSNNYKTGQDNCTEHRGKVLLETDLGPGIITDLRPDTPTPSMVATSSSGVGTSLVSLSNVSVGPKYGQESSDFWNQVVQQVSFIDNSGGSARNSLLLSCGHQIPPGGVSGYQMLVERSSVGLPGSDANSFSTQDSSTPSSPRGGVGPLPLRQQHHFSFRDQARRNRGKLSRFYSQQEPDAPSGASELKVLQPLLPGSDGNQLVNSLSTTGSNGQTSLATVWGGASEGRQIQHPSRRDFRKLQHSNTIAVSGRKRKTSSWEESVSLQRRRSIASREEAREWRDRVLTAEGETVSVATPTSKEDAPQDLRYYFQHPYLRLFATYFVIFCNFLLFAEDPISHSHAESVIPMVGNVFSFVLTKYPPEWRWALIKVLMWLLAIICGLIVGKLFVHNILCGRILRLKMFRDEQGSWIAMFLTVIVSLYIFSHVYNLLLLIFYDKPYYHIDSRMGITYASVMKTAACGTWLGDLITALMVTDVMLQDNLYPEWAPTCRKLWRRSNLPRILIFWVGSVFATAVVVTLIVSDYISWDRLNRDFVASTELSRAFLASFILVMDILIMMQDWDFPHFTTTLHINLPGFSVATLEWKYAEVHLTGKWFNYGLIFMVMLLDLNMWKNQIFYYPARFGQYTAPDDNKIRTLNDQELLQTGNRTLWTWESRSQVNETSGLPYYTSDVKMNSRYMGYPLLLKMTAFIPSGMGMILFISIIVLHGRFPNNQGNMIRGAIPCEGIPAPKDGVSV